MIIVEPVKLGDVACQRPSSKFVYDRTGSLVVVPADTLAVTYDPADLSRPPYALIEPQATNLFESTDRLEAVKWRFTEADYLPERGASDADKPRSGLMRATNVASQHALTHTVVGSPRTAQYTFSVEAKAEGINRVRVQFSAYGNQNAGVVFNLHTGTTSHSSKGSVSGQFDKASITSVGDGWYRCEMTAWPSLVDPSGSFDFGLFLLADDLSSTFAGTGSSGIRFRRWQLEAGDKSTSYIERPTVFNGRASQKQYFDSTGTLQTAAADVLAYTYDPTTLEYRGASLENTATNFIRNNTMQGAATGVPGALPTNWSSNSTLTGLTREIVAVGTEKGIPFIDLRLYGTPSATGFYFIYLETATGVAAVSDNTFALSAFLALAGGSLSGVSAVSLYMDERTVAGAFVTNKVSGFLTVDAGDLNSKRSSVVRTLNGGATVERVQPSIRLSLTGEPLDITIRIGLPQLQRDRVDSPVKTSGAAVTRWSDQVTSPPVTRAADVIGSSAGLVYSNVPEPEPLYSAVATYAQGDRVRDSDHTVYVSLVAGNLGNSLSDGTKWNRKGASNRWAMLDQYNNTQTSNPDEITIVVSPRALTQGLYLGNLLADEVRISVVDLVEGLVYTEVKNLTISNSGSSFYNWSFRRIKRKDYFLSLKLPPYANAVVTINVRKIGAVAKAGMCAIGTVDEFGPTLLGLSTEGKDYSTTTFAVDGESSTALRPYAKRMGCDVKVDNDQIDYVQGRLFELRQRPLVWVGGPYGSTAVFGRYGSFKNVVQYQMQSLMNLTIEGAV